MTPPFGPSTETNHQPIKAWRSRKVGRCKTNVSKFFDAICIPSSLTSRDVPGVMPEPNNSKRRSLGSRSTVKPESWPRWTWPINNSSSWLCIIKIFWRPSLLIRPLCKTKRRTRLIGTRLSASIKSASPGSTWPSKGCQWEKSITCHTSDA